MNSVTYTHRSVNQQGLTDGDFQLSKMRIACSTGRGCISILPLKQQTLSMIVPGSGVLIYY